MRVICEDEEHQERVPLMGSILVIDKEDDRPKRVCLECKDKDRYQVN